jgi:hypothetical protein
METPKPTAHQLNPHDLTHVSRPSPCGPHQDRKRPSAAVLRTMADRQPSARSATVSSKSKSGSLSGSGTPQRAAPVPHLPSPISCAAHACHVRRGGTTLSPQPSALSPQPSALSPQPSALCALRSALPPSRFPLPALRSALCACRSTPHPVPRNVQHPHLP